MSYKDGTELPPAHRSAFPNVNTFYNHGAFIKTKKINIGKYY